MANDTIKYTLDADVSKYQRAMKDAAKVTGDFEQKVKELASDLSGHTAQRGMAQLQAAVKQIGGLSGVSSKQLDILRQQVKALGAAGAKIPSEFAGLNKELTTLQKFSAGLKAGFGIPNGFSAAAIAAGAATAAVAGVGMALRAAIGTITQSVSAAAAFGDAMSNASTRTGVAAETLQGLAVAGRLAGVGFEEVQGAINRMQMAITSGNEAFVKLGMTAEQLRGMAPERAFAAIGDAIAAIESPTQRAALSMEIFGKSGAKMLGVFGSGASEAAKKAKDLGLVMSGEMVSALDQFGDKVDLLGDVWDRLWVNIGAAIASSPGVISALDGITTALGAFSKAAGEMAVDSIAGLTEAIHILTGGAALAFFSDMEKAITGNASAAGKLLGFLKDMVPLFGPLAKLGQQRQERQFLGYETKGTADQLAAFMGDGDGPEMSIDALNAQSDARIEATNKLREAQEKLRRESMAAISAVLDFQDKVTKGVESRIASMFDAQSAAFMASGTDRSSLIPATLLTPMRRGPDLSGIMGGVASGAIVPGAPTAAGPAGFGSLFKSQMMNLPQAILGAFQGGGSIGKSLGGFFGGAAGSSLMGKGIGKLLGGALGSALPGIGTLLGGLGGSLIGKLFGGGKSKEEKEAERQKAEQEKRRIQDAAKQMRSQSIDSLGGTASAFFMGRTITTEDDAKRSGTLFIDAWTQVVKEKGVLAAADAFGGAFDKMKADIEKAGIEMPDWMKFVEGQMGLSKNEGFRAAAQGSQNAAAFLGAMGGSGALSPESFRAFEQEARAQFAAAEGAAAEAGMDSAEATKAGFAATNPLLKGLLNESMVTGQTLSADIQELIDQAGIVPDVDIQQLDELRQIRAAVQAMAGGGGGAVPGPAAGGPGGGSAGVGSGEDRYPGFASGGNVTRTGLALVHAGERVLSKSDVQGGGSNTYHINVQASGNKQTDESLVANLMNTMARLTRKGKGRQFMSALGDDGFARKGKR